MNRVIVKDDLYGVILTPGEFNLLIGLFGILNGKNLTEEAKEKKTALFKELHSHSNYNMCPISFLHEHTRDEVTNLRITDARILELLNEEAKEPLA